ncbi:MAG TPA: thioesterase family protein [Myxococcota bacterium]|nr:thioesterase family protein [Myxococcota bacterium]
MASAPATPPPRASVSRYRHRVAFFETDAMGIVHHSNTVRQLELARVHWLDEHDQPYRVYAEQGLHYATAQLEVDYRRPTRFDDVVEIAVWLDWVRGASLRFAYALHCNGECVATAATVHAMVDREGRVRRIPSERAEHLRALALRSAPVEA